jgi:hypothetical protein
VRRSTVALCLADGSNGYPTRRPLDKCSEIDQGVDASSEISLDETVNYQRRRKDMKEAKTVRVVGDVGVAVHRVACPRCGAQAEENCPRLPRGYTHVERLTAAQDAVVQVEAVAS